MKRFTRAITLLLINLLNLVCFFVYELTGNITLFLSLFILVLLLFVGFFAVSSIRLFVRYLRTKCPHCGRRLAYSARRAEVSSGPEDLARIRFCTHCGERVQAGKEAVPSA